MLLRFFYILTLLSLSTGLSIEFANNHEANGTTISIRSKYYQDDCISNVMTADIEMGFEGILDLTNLNVSSLIDAEERDDLQRYQEAQDQLILSLMPSNDSDLGLVKDFATLSLNAGVINQTCYDHVLEMLNNPRRNIVNRRRELDLAAVITQMTWEEYSNYENGQENRIDPIVKRAKWDVKCSQTNLALASDCKKIKGKMSKARSYKQFRYHVGTCYFMSPKVNTWLTTGSQRFNGYHLLIDDCQRSFGGGLGEPTSMAISGWITKVKWDRSRMCMSRADYCANK